MAGALLADIDQLGRRIGHRQDARTDQPVVDHDLGLAQQARGLEGHQLRIAGAGSDQEDDAVAAALIHGMRLNLLDGARQSHARHGRSVPRHEGEQERDLGRLLDGTQRIAGAATETAAEPGRQQQRRGRGREEGTCWPAAAAAVPRGRRSRRSCRPSPAPARVGPPPRRDPAALALGWSSITTPISARDAMPDATRAAVTVRGSHIGARTMRRASSETISARAPKLPIRLSAMISSARSRSAAGAQAVGGVGETVLVQRTGRQDHRDDRQQRRRQRRQAEPGRGRRRRGRPAGPRRRRPAGRRRPRPPDPAWSPCRRRGRGTGSGTARRP